MSKEATEIKLDKRDRRVLYELDKNCRQQLTALSLRLKLPIETLRYRIQRLIDLGIIKNYLTVIDGGRLGYYYFKVFLKLQKVSEDGVQEIVRKLADNPRICWVVRVDGAYDIGFTPRVSNPLEQSQLMNELREEFAETIQSWTLSINIKMDFLSREYLVESPSRKSVLGTYSTKKEIYRVDSLEEQILTYLSTNPRASGAEIASQLKVSTETVLARIRRLEREEVIVRYMTVIDNELLNQVNLYVLVYFSRIESKREAKFLKFCETHPNIVYFIKALGPWDYELSIEVSSLRDGRELLREMSMEFSDIIRDYQSLHVHEMSKYVYP